MKVQALMSILHAASEEGTQILKQPVSSRQPGYGLQDFNEAERKCRPVLAAFQEASLGVGQSLLLLRQLSQQLGAAARSSLLPTACQNALLDPSREPQTCSLLAGCRDQVQFS